MEQFATQRVQDAEDLNQFKNSYDAFQRKAQSSF